jgi:hypothetical protein
MKDHPQQPWWALRRSLARSSGSQQPTRALPFIVGLIVLSLTGFLAAVRLRGGGPAAPPSLLLPSRLFSLPAAGPLNLSSYEYKVYSQNGEDGILEAIFARVGVAVVPSRGGVRGPGAGSASAGAPPPFYVEFGTETCEECNSRYLRVKGWWGVLLDGQNENATLNQHRHFVDAENIGALLASYGVPREPDLLSVDIDRNDFYVMRALLLSPPPAVTGLGPTLKPRVIVTEFNGDSPPPADRVVAYDPSLTWDGTNYFGASCAAFAALAAKAGYTLVYSDRKGVNLFFVRDDLRPRDHFLNAGVLERLCTPSAYVNCPTKRPAGGHCPDETGRKWLTSEELLVGWERP